MGMVMGAEGIAVGGYGGQTPRPRPSLPRWLKEPERQSAEYVAPASPPPAPESTPAPTPPVEPEPLSEQAATTALREPPVRKMPPEVLARRRAAPSSKCLTSGGRWSDRHAMMARLKVEGHTHKDIAKEVGCSKAWVDKVLASPRGKEEIARLREKADAKAMSVRARMVAVAPDGVDWYVRCITGVEKVSSELRFKMCESLFDRIGFSRKPVDDMTKLAPLADRDKRDRLKALGSELRTAVVRDAEGVIDIQATLAAAVGGGANGGLGTGAGVLADTMMPDTGDES